MITRIPATEIHRRRSAGEAVRLIDVRTPIEHRAEHAVGVELIPLDRLDPARHVRPGETVALLCQSGARAEQAAQRLAASGCTCLVVDGGTAAWVAAGLPVVRTRTLGLMRQVQLIAGALVLTGAGLGAFVHPGWIGLSAFVGAGLMVAGATGWCGMALLLAKAPWNRVAVPDAAAPTASGAAPGQACTLRRPG